MKYVVPYGISEIDAPYINGDPSRGIQGSIPPANAFEHPMREIVGVIDNSNFVPSATDLLQLTKSVRSQFLNFAADTGAANTLSVAFDPPLTAYTVGLPLRVLVKTTNTGPSTIDAGAGRVNIRRPNGLVLQAGDLNAGGLVDLVYDGTLFQMINFGGGTGAGGGTINYNLYLPYIVDTGTPNLIVANFVPAITTLAAGAAILVKVINFNTGPTVINVNALTGIPVKAQGGGDLLPYDVLAGSVFLFVYDGTSFYVNPNPTIEGDITINVPSTQFNTPLSVFTQLKRKLIGPTVSVKIKLAIGVYDPFTIEHPSSGRLRIEGTMKPGMTGPTLGNFQMSGNDAGSRANDAAANIAMLRARYGTEVRAPSGFQGTCIGVAAGVAPVIADILCTATNYYQTNCNGIGYNKCTLTNCSVTFCYSGIYANAAGNITATNCWACGCRFGLTAGAAGALGVTGGGALGNEFGYTASGMSLISCGSTYARFNGVFGYSAGSGSTCGLSAADGLANGSFDCYASLQSVVTVNGGFGSFSPALNTEGNMNSIMQVA